MGKIRGKMGEKWPKESGCRCEAILIGVYGFDSERTDAIASLVVSATILVGCAVAAVLWVRSAVRFCRADGRDGGAAAEPQAPRPTRQRGRRGACVSAAAPRRASGPTL